MLSDRKLRRAISHIFLIVDMSTFCRSLLSAYFHEALEISFRFKHSCNGAKWICGVSSLVLTLSQHFCSKWAKLYFPLLSYFKELTKHGFFVNAIYTYCALLYSFLRTATIVIFSYSTAGCLVSCR